MPYSPPIGTLGHPWPDDHTLAIGKPTSRSQLSWPNMLTFSETPINTLHYREKDMFHPSYISSHNSFSLAY